MARCKAKTKAGHRCSRAAMWNALFRDPFQTCKQHRVWHIEFVEYATDKVVKTLTAKGERTADKIDDGLNINLNHERFFTRIAEPPRRKDR